MAMEGLMRIDEVEEYMYTNRSTLAGWRCQGKGPKYIKIGKNVRYRKVDIDEYIASIVITPRNLK